MRDATKEQIMGKFLPFVFSLHGKYCLYTDIELYAAVIQAVFLCSESEQKAHLSEEKIILTPGATNS